VPNCFDQAVTRKTCINFKALSFADIFNSLLLPVTLTLTLGKIRELKMSAKGKGTLCLLLCNKIQPSCKFYPQVIEVIDGN